MSRRVGRWRSESVVVPQGEVGQQGRRQGREVWEGVSNSRRVKDEETLDAPCGAAPFDGEAVGGESKGIRLVAPAELPQQPSPPTAQLPSRVFCYYKPHFNLLRHNILYNLEFNKTVFLPRFTIKIELLVNLNQFSFSFIFSTRFALALFCERIHRPLCFLSLEN